MPDTSQGLTYPGSTGHARIWEHLQALAEDVDVALSWLRNKPAAMLRQTSAQSFPASTYVPVTWQTEDLDDDPDGVGGHSTSVNASRYTARYAGWYRVGGGFSFASNATGIRHAVWAVNGTTLSGTAIAVDATANSSSTRLPMRSLLVNLGVGDYVELWAWQGSGSSLSSDATGAGQGCMSIDFVRNQ